MAKKETELKLLEKQVKDVIEIVNSHIETLGIESEKMYDILRSIQDKFDLIRGVPREEELKLEEINKLSKSWKLQAENIEKEYEEFCSKNAVAGGGGVVLGVGAVFFGPKIAMGVATTFGVSSTGTAISALNGVTATNAALAWLGGGTLAAGGGGIVKGQALLALAGPIGWTIGITSLAALGIILFWKRSRKKHLEKVLQLIAKRDIATYNLAKLDIIGKIELVRKDTSDLNNASNDVSSFGTDYSAMSKDQQYKLGVYVNLMLSSISNLVRPIKSLIPKIDESDICIVERFYHPHTLIKQKYKLVINLADFIHDIELTDDDLEVLYDSLKKNKKLLESVRLTKLDFEKDIILMARTLNKYKSSAEYA